MGPRQALTFKQQGEVGEQKVVGQERKMGPS
jgi:hypothetical protein